MGKIEIPNRQKLLAQYRDGLLKDTMPFWFPRSIDRQHGGFLHCFDADGSLVDSDKSVWAQGRMSWMLLTIYNTVEKRTEWLEWATQGLEFIKKHCFDADGRMFFHVAQDGRPIRKRRYAISEVFASIAFAAHAKATGSSESADYARRTFDLFARWTFEGLGPPKFCDTRKTMGIGARMIALVTAQELRDNLKDASYNAWIDRCIGEMRDYFVKPELQVVMETVGPRGEILDHFDGRTLNPGHAIEGAWFILHEGRRRNDSSLIRLGCDMLDWMWERGWDKEFGGILYFVDVYGKPVQEYWHDMKFWWPQNETIIATLLAGVCTGEKKYFDWHRQINDWAHEKFHDPVHGEWFGYLHRDGRRSNTLKGSLWKSFFHHPRMQWYCWKLLEGAQ